MTETPPILLVDMGNTRLKSALWWADNWRDLPPCAWGSAAENALLFAELWAGAQPARVLCCNVAGLARADDLRRWCRQQWGLEVEFFDSTSPVPGLRCGYREPRQLGDDRWMAVVAAHALYPGEPCCVIDCGTATTVDLLAAGGEHLGGAILPGIGTMRRALVSNTADLPPASGEPVAFARDTVAAIAGGTAYALAGAIERLLCEARERVGGALHCVLTGGEAAQIKPLLREAMEIHPQLVLRGLVEAARLS